MCFVNGGNKLCCYVRETSYLSYFDLKNDYKQTKMSLNGGSAGTNSFDGHVSFCVLSLVPSPCEKYLGLATDASRNIVMETGTDRIVRNLYGHKNDGFSNPKIAWSKVSCVMVTVDVLFVYHIYCVICSHTVCIHFIRRPPPPIDHR